MQGESRVSVFDLAFAAILALWLLSVILLGGTGFPSDWKQYWFAGSSVAIIAVALLRLRGGFPTGAAATLAVIGSLAVALVLGQLLPIPYAIWSGLPGREIFVNSFVASGISPKQIPLSLDPTATRTTALALLPPLAAFLGTISLKRNYFWFLSLSILIAASVGLVLGLLQRSGGVESGLYFYTDPGQRHYATGTFANRNFFATQLFCALPFLAAFAMTMAAKLNLRPILTFGFTLVFMGVIIAVLAAVGSRAGILLAMVSLLVTVLLVLRLKPQGRSSASLGTGLVVALVALVIMAQASMVGILRLAETDPLADSRGMVSAVSFAAAKAQFPIGSGFGTFVPVYQLHETPATILNQYANQAHNDWLQMVIEGGAAALILQILFVVWLLYMLVKALRLAAQDPENAHIRAAGLAAVLILVHAVVDFPFRNAAMATFFGVCVGLLALVTARHAQTRARAPARPATSIPPVQRQRKPFTPVQGHFKPRPAPTPAVEPTVQTVEPPRDS
jgi:O-antigen ligase